MLNLQRLEALHLFAQRGTIAGAADSLGFSAAAVSQQLAALERETGAALLERSARSATLTPSGRALAARAAQILDLAESARAEALAVGDDMAGEVVVSAIPTTMTVLAPALSRFMSTHAEVHVVLHQSSPARALEALRSRDLDVAVVDEWKSVAHRGVTRTRLAPDPLLLVLPPDHPMAHSTDPVSLDGLAAAVKSRTWLCAPRDQPSRTPTDTLLSRSLGKPSAVWEVEGLTTIAQLVAQGVGVALLPALALRDLAPGCVATRPLRPARQRTLVAMSRDASRSHPVVSACLAAVRGAQW